MKLVIEIEDITSANAIDILNGCQNAIYSLNEKGTLPIEMQFKFEDEEPKITYRESTPFQRYIQSTTKEGE